MHRNARGIVALGAATVLSLGLISPAASATTAPTTSASTSTRTTDHPLIENRALEAFERAVEPSECSPTLLDAYVGGLVAEMTAEQFAFLMTHSGTLFVVPSYDALFFGTEGDPDYALRSHAGDLRHTFRDLKRFWSDVRSDDIQLLAMRGDVLLDADRIAASLSRMVELGVSAPMNAEEIATEARTVADFMATQGDLHRSPLWTLNAFAFSGEGDADQEIAALPDKIVFGDGLIAAYDAIGLGDVGPRAVMAHEFAHQIQYELGTFDTGPAEPVEANRRTELMADALATYYAVHKKGLALNRKRAVDALLSFSSLGDCLFASPAHHGTALQRERAAAWGADLAAAARPRSLVLSAGTVIERFDAALPGIVAGS